MIQRLSVYLFIYYFFIRVVYTYYGNEFNVSVWVYRIGFYTPLILWFILIIKDLYENFNIFKNNIYFKILLVLLFYMGVSILY